MGKRGRELELCKEWGDGTDGSNYDDWLEQKVIAVERDLAARDEQLAALGPWTVQALRQYVADTSDGFECETGCDSYGHTEFCPVTNTVQAFRLLRERLAELDAEFAHEFDERTKLLATVRERDERILKLENLAAEIGTLATQNAAFDLRENTRLEQQLKAAQERYEALHVAYHGAACVLSTCRFCPEYFAKHSPSPEGDQ